MLFARGCRTYWRVRLARLLCSWSIAYAVASVLSCPISRSRGSAVARHTVDVDRFSARPQYVAKEEVRRPNGAYLFISMVVYQLYGPMPVVDVREYARCAIRHAGSLLSASILLLGLCAIQLQLMFSLFFASRSIDSVQGSRQDCILVFVHSQHGMVGVDARDLLNNDNDDSLVQRCGVLVSPSMRPALRLGAARVHTCDIIGLAPPKLHAGLPAPRAAQICCQPCGTVCRTSVEALHTLHHAVAGVCTFPCVVQNRVLQPPILARSGRYVGRHGD